MSRGNESFLATSFGYVTVIPLFPFFFPQIAPGHLHVVRPQREANPFDISTAGHRRGKCLLCIELTHLISQAACKMCTNMSYLLPIFFFFFPSTNEFSLTSQFQSNLTALKEEIYSCFKKDGVTNIPQKIDIMNKILSHHARAIINVRVFQKIDKVTREKNLNLFYEK